MKLVRGSVKDRANFDIYNLNPIQNLGECFIPALFAHGEQDTFILPHHSQRMYDKYAGDKNIIKFEGDHNSNRPMFFFDSAVIFLIGTLQVEQMLTESNMMNEEQRKWWSDRAKQRRENQAKQPQPHDCGPKTDIDMALGLDDNNTGMFDNFKPAMASMGQPAMSEEDELQAAIKASLADMGPQQPQQPEPDQPAPE